MRCWLAAQSRGKRFGLIWHYCGGQNITWIGQGKLLGGFINGYIFLWHCYIKSFSTSYYLNAKYTSRINDVLYHHPHLSRKSVQPVRAGILKSAVPSRCSLLV